MRDILFRGKAINRIKGRAYRTNYKNGDWVYGLVTRLYDERFEELPAEMTNEYGVSGIEVDYRTIGQYTGLTDCKGNKIFEGDIVQFFYDFEHGTALGIVKYGRYTDVDSFGDYDYLGWYIDVQKNCVAILSPESDNIQMKIVGNIYDNSKLLEVVENGE